MANDAERYAAPAAVGVWQPRMLLLGVVGLVAGLGASFAMGGLDRAVFSWLIGYWFWCGIALGSMALMLLHCLTGGSFK